MLPGIIGFSMGTIMGSEVAASGGCDFLIAEGYVTSPRRLVAEQFGRYQKTVTLPAEAADYALVARRVHCPWLLVGGTIDKNTPLADSVVVARQARWRQRRPGEVTVARTFSPRIEVQPKPTSRKMTLR